MSLHHLPSRPVTRRRVMHWCVTVGKQVAWCVVLLIFFVVLLVFLGVHENPCEPNQNC